MNTSEQAITTTYHDVENHIKKICWQFYKKFGGDFDDYLSEANYVFVKSYESYDHTKGAYTTFLHHCISNRLKYIVKQKHKWKGMWNTNCELKFATAPTLDLHDFAKNLSDDAQDVLNLVFDGPDCILQSVGWLGENQNIWKQVLRGYLSSQGWQYQRVLEAFQEIRKAL